MNKKILVIANENNYTVDIFTKKQVDVSYAYGKNNRLLKKIAKRIWHFIKMPGFDLFFGFRHLNIKNYNAIILYECTYPFDVVKYLLNKTEKTKIIYWYWNPIAKQRNTITYNAKSDLGYLLSLREKYPDRLYLFSFDRDDCKKYNLCYNNQVAPQLCIHTEKYKLKQDVFFCGQDKNRYKLLKELAKKLDDCNITYKFILRINKKHDYKNDKDIISIIDEIPYKNLIINIAESGCILDLVQENQGGITWRPLEALFYEKKLITSFKEIVNYDFYCRENIFILGVDDINELQEFIQTPYERIDKDIIQKYTTDGWLENFLTQINC